MPEIDLAAGLKRDQRHKCMSEMESIEEIVVFAEGYIRDRRRCGSCRITSLILKKLCKVDVSQARAFRCLLSCPSASS